MTEKEVLEYFKEVPDLTKSELIDTPKKLIIELGEYKLEYVKKELVINLYKHLPKITIALVRIYTVNVDKEFLDNLLTTY